MRLSDIVQHADLDLWPQLALVFFLLAFGLTLVRVFGTSRAKDRAIANIVLDEDEPVTRGEGRRRG